MPDERCELASIGKNFVRLVTILPCSQLAGSGKNFVRLVTIMPSSHLQVNLTRHLVSDASLSQFTPAGSIWHESGKL
jgi:hypothetical protein